MRMHSPVAALIAAAVSVSPASSWSAERIVFSQDAFGAEEAFIRAYADTRAEGSIDGPLRDAEIFVARFDLNGDDRYELFIMVERSEFCGANTCRADVFKRSDGRWLLLTVIDAPATLHPSIVASDERREGYVSLLNGDEVQYWEGGQYRSECLSRRCFMDSLEE